MWKHRFFLLLLTTALMFVLLPAQDTDEPELLMHVPVRVWDGSHYIDGLTAPAFSLAVNDSPRQIKEVSRHTQGLMDNGANRFIVLSFDTTGMNDNLKSGLTAFLDKVLKGDDLLLIHTPVDNYKVDTSAAKDKVIGFIATILENDLLQRARDKEEALRHLKSLIVVNEKKLDSKKLGIRSALMFANQFHEAWRNYYEGFLTAQLSHYSEIAGRMAAHKGEKRHIHFQEGNLQGLQADFERFSAALNTFAGKLPETYQKSGALLMDTLGKIHRAMNLKGAFPMEDLLNQLVGVNINCSVLFLHPGATTRKEPVRKEPVQAFENILETIARHTGGIAVSAGDPGIADALEMIRSHRDVYYSIVFAFNGKAEDKRLAVSVSGDGMVLFYKTLFRKAEFNWVIERYQTLKPVIDGFSLEEHTLSFHVAGFMEQQGKGLLEVTVKLLDSNGSTVYETSNSLTLSDSRVSVTMQLPATQKGYFKLVISVRDGLSNKDAALNQYVQLK